MNTDRDTIAAIATASGESGIAIVRLSGPRAFAVADALYRGPSPPPSGRAGGSFVHGHIHAPGQPAAAVDVDEVIMLIYRAPRSYTREDVVEMQGHGGRICARRILRAVLAAGARAADPGEFTRRAFLNGRIDLLQAEAVADLIRARSDRAASAAIEQLEGHLTCWFVRTYDVILSIAADLEATLDFAEDELPETTMTALRKRMGAAASGLQDILATWEEGHLLREGALVVIAGRPNVGKSTLLNRLLGTARAIVTETPGTTRDTIEEQFVLDGVPLRLVDTAGLREADCHIEREGIQRAQAIIARSDLVLYMVDASQPLCSEDRVTINTLLQRPHLLVLNKSDLGRELGPAHFPCSRTVASALLGESDMSEIKRAMLDQLGMHVAGPPHAVISERHRNIIQCALNEVNAAGRIIADENEESAVMAAEHLRDALEMLGAITGRVYSKELLENIFSRFCIGK